ncbi:eukaryotic translation initiation factor 4E1-like [Cylas formicarius]|uniref:eukaryotic translation initiation factor 4E1-like n=1 Tax=Cylas formicarius TaxID=197179 RepID=UPI002958C810|nr:eukaryotic translation initiation factor 4E1-like [Cylas formicarius]
MSDETDVEPRDSYIDVPVKHPLQHCWTLWYHQNDKNVAWEMSQREIASFQTVEDFWMLYNHIKPASELKHGSDYAVFRKGIRPMWEDPANRNGGRWLINLDRKQRSGELDRYWLDIMLYLVGEEFEMSKEICGAVVNSRYRGDKIAVWTTDASNSEAVLGIGRKLRDRLHIPLRNLLGYQVHRDVMDRSGSGLKYTYIM